MVHHASTGRGLLFLLLLAALLLAPRPVHGAGGPGTALFRSLAACVPGPALHGFRA